MKRIDTAKVRIPGTSLRGWRAIAVGALGIYIVLFIILNNRELRVNFVFFETRSNELLSLIVIVILGFAAGFILGGRRRRPQAEPRNLEPPAEAPATAPPDEGAAVSRGEDAEGR
jgi:uncharacterized integral membrane protein